MEPFSHPWSYRTHVTRGSRCEPDSVFASPLHTQPRARSYACVSHSFAHTQPRARSYARVSHSLTHAAASHEVLRHVSHVLTHAAASHEVLRHVSHSPMHAAASHEVLRHVSHSPMHAAASHEVLRHVSHLHTHKQLSTPRTRTAPRHDDSHLQSRTQSHGGCPSADTAAAAIAAAVATVAAADAARLQAPLLPLPLLALSLPALPLLQLLLAPSLPLQSVLQSAPSNSWLLLPALQHQRIVMLDQKDTAQSVATKCLACMLSKTQSMAKAASLHRPIRTIQNHGWVAC
jgi:hypothetical protein